MVRKTAPQLSAEELERMSIEAAERAARLRAAAAERAERDARIIARRDAGLCVFDGCEGTPNPARFHRCREHDLLNGANPLPATPHRSVQHHGWRNYWEG